MPKERSVPSRLAEHRKFREQCRRRIRPAITLFLLIVAAVITWVSFLPTSWWMVTIALALSGGTVFMEIFHYRYHDRKWKELSEEHSA